MSYEIISLKWEFKNIYVPYYHLKQTLFIFLLFEKVDF